MADSNHDVIFPPPPRVTSWPPTQAYFNELNRWYENVQRYMTGVNFIRFSGLFTPVIGGVTGFPTTAYDLKIGFVWANDGVLTLVREGDTGVEGVAAAVAVGTVTVTT